MTVRRPQRSLASVSTAAACSITPGHEFTGYVVEAGNVFSCPDMTRNGLGFGVNGVFAEYIVLHNAMLNVSIYPLPDNVNDLAGATCEPMRVGASMADALDGDGVCR